MRVWTPLLLLTSRQQGQIAVKDHRLRNLNFSAYKICSFSSVNRSLHAAANRPG